ncbi:hypothetical protein LARI1_G003433 [Lachnellula arida]|uniref:Uncharacterized protein n=1 Tax=Lachnellula arida TaxID=1316785 RepID=A0A8T9BJ09_9HELO|nr:hypothetical protein LARI1_G003433 [Lachnellula arida]
MASIYLPVTEPPGPDNEVAIIKQLWGKDIAKGQADAYRSYFRYYSTECRRLQMGISKESWLSSTMAAKTHADILFIVHTLSLESQLYRPDVRALLRHRFVNSDDLAVNRSIDFALRAWLTLNVREERFSLHTPSTPVMEWDDNTTLADFVERNFPNASPTSSVPSLQFDHAFTMASMNRLSGIEVEWTPCLADHLRFDKRRRITWERATEKPDTAIRTLIPRGILRETVLSLSLLFPRWDIHTDNFMLQYDQTFHLEAPFSDPHPQHLSEFSHWRNRLMELHQIFHSPPIGWTQLWTDRRNPLQWYTFWIAIVILVLTVVLGVISTVTAVMQTCFAYEALKLTRAQSLSASLD